MNTSDRFIAQHLAMSYYWIVVPIYMLFSKYVYCLMELIENHAFHTVFVNIRDDES